MPNIPAMYDGGATGNDEDSNAGGATTPATPASGASQPGAAMEATTSTAPATTPQPDQQNATPDTLSSVERSIKADNWSTKVYHGVLAALGGGGDVSYARDPKTGAMVATPVATGPGTQWKKIIAGVIAGTGAALQSGLTGPGAGLRAAGAGISAGEKLGAGREQQKRDRADQDYEAGQKNAVQQAQLALLSHQVAKGSFELGRAQVQASVEDSDRETNFEKVIGDGGAGSTDMGVFPDFQSVIKAFKDAPELHDHQAGGRIVTIPHINSKGQVDGVHAALVTPDWLTQKINRDLPITTRTYRDGKMEEQTFTIPAGSLTGLQYAQMVQAQSKDAIEDWTKTAATNLADKKETSEEALRKSEEAKNYSASAKDRTETKALNEATDQNTIQSNAQQLVEGTMDPANLSKRSKSYDPTLAAANAYSMQKYNRPFDVAKASGDYKFATNVGTYNTLNYLNSLTGRDDKSGNLGSVIELSDKLKRSDLPPLNAVEQWAKLSAGNSEIPAYRGALVEVSDQIAKVLQGGGTGNGTSDTKLKQAQDLLSRNFNPRQMRDTAIELRVLLGNRKREIIGDNRYLMQWHGVQQQPGGGTATGQPQTLPGTGKSISIADALKLPQYQGKTAAQVRADAEKLNYTVTE